jgi:hypothetical protein
MVYIGDFASDDDASFLQAVLQHSVKDLIGAGKMKKE